MVNADRRHVLVIGGGVIGLACAHYLAASGFRVTVIDQGLIGGGCSHGNCGLVCPSHVLPLAEPGALAEALKGLLNPRGAFRIRPRLDFALWRWLWRFASRCNRRDMLESGHAIQPLLTSSLKLYAELVENEALECEWQRRGLLFVYRSQRRLDAYRPVNELLASEFNEPARLLNGEELRAFEPSLRGGLPGAWYFEYDAHLRPDRLLTSWRSLLTHRGVRFVENCGLQSLKKVGDSAVAARTTCGSIEADSIVMAVGAWAPRLSKILGFRAPIEPGKGYSVTMQRPESCPRVPMVFPEHRVVVTPLDTEMRIGSIMEFSGFDDGIRQQRLQLLTRAAAHYLHGPLPDRLDEEWYGWRPMTYDSTPIIGRCPSFSNVYLATGHNMLGLSMAPATGRLIAELITDTNPHLPPESYSPERFMN